jgi:chromosome partitioning protein
MKRVAVCNHKGGVGKTTLTGSIAQALALCGFRVLAIDNDSQHNLSALLGTGVHSPNIRDVYRSSGADAAGLLLRSIRKTEIADLHVITAPTDLREADIRNIAFLGECLDKCNLERFYDYLLIDNAPGLDRLQAAALHAVDELFVPTELKQFAVNGIVEMERVLQERFPAAPRITKIVPTFYRNTKRQNSFLLALQTMFPGRVTATAIPLDPVFDEIITEGKILFLHRLTSKGAAYCLKLMHELFNLDEDFVWENMLEKRRLRQRDEARQRFFAQSSRTPQGSEQPDKGTEHD